MITVNYQYWSMQSISDGETASIADYIETDDSNIRNAFSTMVERESNVVVRCGNGFGRRLLQYVKENYIFVKAAGGIVYDRNGRMLIMTRNERSDLPKGKVEKGETLAEAALRETAEETGIDNVELGRLIVKTYHIYDLYGGWHFKQTSWFEMKGDSGQDLVPQTEEGITDVSWVTPDEWKRRLDNSYATMRILSDKTVVN